MLQGDQVINRNDTALKEIALVTQMRAGTHYLCLALRLALEATIYRPNREQRYVMMEDDYVLRGLHADSPTQAAGAQSRPQNLLQPLLPSAASHLARYPAHQSDRISVR